MAVEITETPRHTLTVSEQNWQLKLSTLSVAALPDDATFNTVTVNSILTAGTVTAAEAMFNGLVSQTGLGPARSRIGGSTYFGEGAGIADDLSANNNVGVGFQALKSNTTGAQQHR
jgi:hypothetical protein